MYALKEAAGGLASARERRLGVARVALSALLSLSRQALLYFNDYETRLVLRGVVELQNTKTPSSGIAARCLFFPRKTKGSKTP